MKIKTLFKKIATYLAIFSVMFGAIFSANLVINSAAHAQTAETTQANYQPAEDERPTCIIAGYGWIICPILQFTSKITDQLFKMLTPLLKFESLTNSRAYQSIETVWVYFRNIANIMAMIVLIGIILMQVSSLSAFEKYQTYTLKRIIPRLVVVVVLINISLPLATVAVDISNILGVGVREAISLTAIESVEENSITQEVTAGILSGATVTTIGAATAVGIGGLSISGGFYGLLLLLVPAVIVSFIALLVAVVILIARQALLIVLIILMPVALICQLFKLSTDYWSRWLKYFLNMLALFPLVSLLFGVSSLSSHILMTTGGKDSALMAVAAVAVQALPLFMLPLVLRSAGKLGGVTGMASRMSGAMGGYVNKQAVNAIERQRKIAAANKINELSKSISQNPNASRMRKAARRTLHKVAGGSLFRDYQARQYDSALDEGVQASALQYKINTAADRLKLADGKLVKDAFKRESSVILASQNLSQFNPMNSSAISAYEEQFSQYSASEISLAIKNPNLNNHEKVALLRTIASGGDYDQTISYAQTLVDKNVGENYSPMVADGVAVALNSAMPEVLEKDDVAIILENPGEVAKFDIREAITKNVENGGISPEDIVKMDTELLKYLVNNSTPLGKQNLQKAAEVAVNHPELKDRLANFGYVSEFVRQNKIKADAKASEPAASQPTETSDRPYLHQTLGKKSGADHPNNNPDYRP